MAQIQFTAAPSGSGKSYRRGPHFIINDWLPHYKGIHFSNFPLNIDEIVKLYLDKNPLPKGRLRKLLYKIFVAKGRSLTEQQIRDRIKIIPDDVLKLWKEKQSGPWEYFVDKKTQGAWIAIDEIHHYCSKDNTPKDVLERWKAWLGEARHMGVISIEVISQYETKVAPAIRNEAAENRTLHNLEDTLDPFLGIRMGDWYELRAGFTRRYIATIWERLAVKTFGVWVTRQSVKFRFEPEYFKCYNSYSAPIAGGGTGGELPKAFVDQTRMGMVKWFLSRNWFTIVCRSVVFCFVIWLLAFGGLNVCIQWFTAQLAKAASANSSSPGQPLDAQSATVAAISATSAALSASSSTAAAQPVIPTPPPPLRLRYLSHNVMQLSNKNLYRLGDKVPDLCILPYPVFVYSDLNRRRAYLSDGSWLSF